MNVFSSKTKIFVGAHDICSVFGKPERVFVVADKFMHKSGKVAYVTDQLDKCGAQYRIFSDVTPDPDISVVTQGVSEIMDFKPDAVVAFGGGSAIDAAKAVIFFANKACDLKDVPFIAIPTTSGTGSEVTKFSVISDNEKHVKYPLINDELLPDAAILDAELIRSVPPAVTADTGIDVLTHAIEAYVSKEANDFTDAMAEKACKLVYRHLLTAYREPDNLEARQGMHNASCIAGIAFSNASLGLNHGMAHAMGAKLHLPHGRANGILLPYVMSYNMGCSHTLTKTAERYAQLSEVLGMGAASTRQSALNLIRTVRRFCESMKIPASIAAAGIAEQDFSEIVEEMSQTALADRCTATNPEPATTESIREIYCKAYHGKLQ